LAAHTPFAESKMYDVRANEQLVAARVALAQGEEHAGHAIELLLPLLRKSEERGLVAYVIEIQALLALAYAARNERAASLSALTCALEQAIPEGYIRLFVDLGAPMANLLTIQAARYAPGDPMAQSIDRLLVILQFGHAAAPAQSLATQGNGFCAPPASLVEPLSRREREVLRLLATGQSTQAIAETLVIAISTVKMHLRNIYSKLDAHSRTQAVARGRSLGLL
jgi:LuxR family maltose regulon positive regulatory protein